MCIFLFAKRYGFNTEERDGKIIVIEVEPQKDLSEKELLRIMHQ